MTPHFVRHQTNLQSLYEARNGLFSKKERLAALEAAYGEKLHRIEYFHNLSDQIHEVREAFVLLPGNDPDEVAELENRYLEAVNTFNALYNEIPEEYGCYKRLKGEIIALEESHTTFRVQNN